LGSFQRLAAHGHSRRVLFAIALPGSLWAVSVTNVAITDPSTGNRAKVDTAHELSVTDRLTDQRVTATNLVSFFSFGFSSSCANFYTIPAGKALIVTSATFYMKGPGGTDSELYVYNQANCGGTPFASAISDRKAETVVNVLGSGYPIPGGRVISVGANADNGSGVQVYGYLIPAAQLPTTTTAPVHGSSLSKTLRG